MNLNFLNNKSSKLSINSKVLLLALLVTILVIDVSCKKYTNKSEPYSIVIESTFPIEKVYYSTNAAQKRGISFADFHSKGKKNSGQFSNISEYIYELDTNLVTNNIYSIGISYFFDVPSGDSVNAIVKAKMIRTETNEVLFEKRFHEDYEIGSFRINL